MLRLILLFISLSLLSACDYIVYKPDVTQGNLLSEEIVAKIEPGMTKEQVVYILGPAMLIDTFHQNRWDYLYDNKPTRGEHTRYHLVIFFEDNKVREIRRETKEPLPQHLTETPIE